MQVWFNGRTSAFQAEYVGSIPITCSQLLNLESWYGNILYIIYARVAQLVEHDLAKVGAAGSSPVSRSLLKEWEYFRNKVFSLFFFLQKMINND